MATINTFEELEIWKLAKAFCSEIGVIINNTPLKDNWKLRDQIDSSSGSIMDNIAEGFERGGTKEFIQFLGFAKGSCGESRSQLYRIYDRNFISLEKFTELIEMTESISKQLNGFISYLKKTNIKGFKFEEQEAVYFTESIKNESQIFNI